LVKKAGDLTRFNLAINKISQETRIILKLPEVSKFEGTIYRFIKPEFKETMWKVGPYDINNVYHYSGNGVGAIYGSLTEEGLAGEMLKYKIRRESVFIDSKVAKLNILDMTDPTNLQRFGVTKSMLTDPDNYFTTQVIGQYAKRAGVDGMKVYSATSDATHIAIFKSIP
jgi:hypothetical protein